ncbi:MAG: HlyD family secretion protein [Bacteroidaceae bacterium]|nr:HlyD family secretion protein [Bacteroidaceae bacterium]
MEKHRLTTIIYNCVIVGFLLAGAIIVTLQFVHFAGVEFTDNARVRQHITPQNTRVQGFIREVRFHEFQQVHKGDTLVVIEPAEFRLRLAQAEADLARAEQGSKATGSSIHTTEGNIAVTEASIEEARAQMENALREDKRFEKLLSEDAVTRQQYDNVHTAYLSAKARYEQVQRSQTAQHLVKAEQHHLSAANATLEVARAAVDLARLNLSYCYITATCDGVLGTKDIQEGQLVQPGQTMVNIVSDDEIWVEANFKESQLHHIHVGSEVKMTADAVPDVEYKGRVERISDATGSAFSLLPIDNATGNFVKVEQRVTVRIALDEADADKLEQLRAGYNVECKVTY